MSLLYPSPHSNISTKNKQKKINSYRSLLYPSKHHFFQRKQGYYTYELIKTKTSHTGQAQAHARQIPSMKNIKYIQISNLNDVEKI